MQVKTSLGNLQTWVVSFFGSIQFSFVFFSFLFWNFIWPGPQAVKALRNLLLLLLQQPELVKAEEAVAEAEVEVEEVEEVGGPGRGGVKDVAPTFLGGWSNIPRTQPKGPWGRLGQFLKVWGG